MTLNELKRLIQSQRTAEDARRVLEAIEEFVIAFPDHEDLYNIQRGGEVATMIIQSEKKGKSVEEIIWKEPDLPEVKSDPGEKSPPWHIEERGGKFCVVRDEDGTTEKCHDTRDEALAHLRALYANEPGAAR